jgi:hypothetical protein
VRRSIAKLSARRTARWSKGGLWVLSGAKFARDVLTRRLGIVRRGGGLFSSGELTVRGTTFHDNVAGACFGCSGASAASHRALRKTPLGRVAARRSGDVALLRR